ncbi:hypothetical protein GOP47_0024444 [Adiantum capillus-veneris]|uniref:Uncharacterized protein n=1 Tax=Adiantum capillus-veneris TaxID=13818 RepID=A0A9D4Z3P5_ADICA|nr:hypothetical protein GOP47_0024444 [Adiantum capillus-veneris]
MSPQYVGSCYKRATAVICACNLVIVFCIIYVLFITSSSSLSALMPKKYEPQGLKLAGEEAARYHASVEARRAMEPVKLIKRVKEINEELYRAKTQNSRLAAARKKYAAQLTQKLKQLKRANATVHQQAFAEWQRKKLDRRKANAGAGLKNKQT